MLSLQNKKLRDDLNSNVAGEKDTVTNWRKSLELEKVTRLKVKVLYLIIYHYFYLVFLVGVSIDETNSGKCKITISVDCIVNAIFIFQFYTFKNR